MIMVPIPLLMPQVAIRLCFHDGIPKLDGAHHFREERQPRHEFLVHHAANDIDHGVTWFPRFLLYVLDQHQIISERFP